MGRTLQRLMRLASHAAAVACTVILVVSLVLWPLSVLHCVSIRGAWSSLEVGVSNPGGRLLVCYYHHGWLSPNGLWMQATPSRDAHGESWSYGTWSCRTHTIEDGTPDMGGFTLLGLGTECTQRWDARSCQTNVYLPFPYVVFLSALLPSHYLHRILHRRKEQLAQP